jgi:hypothetical protein
MKGYARIVLHKGGRTLADVERTVLPGSPADPPPTRAVQFKIADCLGAFEAEAGRPFAAVRTLGVVPDIAQWLSGSPA